MSCGGSSPRRRRGVLGKRGTISVWLPQRRDPPSCWSGDLQEVQQVRSLFVPGQCLLRCHTGEWWWWRYLAVCRFSLLSSSSLSISNLRPSDSGFFHCRMLLPGLFNDQTATLHLIVRGRMLVSLCHNTCKHTLYCLVWRKIRFIWQFVNALFFYLSSKMTQLALNLPAFINISELNVKEYCCCCAITQISNWHSTNPHFPFLYTLCVILQHTSTLHNPRITSTAERTWTLYQPQRRTVRKISSNQAVC